VTEWGRQADAPLRILWLCSTRRERRRAYSSETEGEFHFRVLYGLHSLVGLYLHTAYIDGRKNLGTSENNQHMHWIVPLLYSIHRLLHVSAVVCHHQGASWIRLSYSKCRSNMWFIIQDYS
jgi:hypothetical protein